LVITRGVALRRVYDRFHDTSPYYGGGEFTNSTGGACSTGFTVRHVGFNRLLTAGHCAMGGENVVTGEPGHNSNRYVGTVVGRLPDRDTELIAPYEFGYTAAGRIFTGDDTFSDPYASFLSMPVGGVQQNLYGQYIFTSGGRSGYRGNSKIVEVNVANLAEDGTWCSPRHRRAAVWRERRRQRRQRRPGRRVHQRLHPRPGQGASSPTTTRPPPRRTPPECRKAPPGSAPGASCSHRYPRR
jgi:hypothetical protein